MANDGTSDGEAGCIVFIMGFLCGAFIIGGLTSSFTNDYWQKNAIKNGNAEYIINKKAESEFRIIPHPKDIKIESEKTQ